MVPVTNPTNTVATTGYFLAQDALVYQEGTGSSASAQLTTSAAPDLLVVFVAADGPATHNAQSATVSGAGLTWTLRKRSNYQYGTAEVWTASAPASLSNATITSTLAVSYGQSLTVVAYRGATGVGASAAANAASGAPSVQLTTTRPASRILAVGNDWDTATARTLGSNQIMLHQYLNTSTGDTWWVQANNANTPASGTAVTMNDTAPTNDKWNFVAVEVCQG